MRKLPPKSVILIGIVSLLINISTAIVYNISSYYLTSLGVSDKSFGLIEGIVEGLAWGSRFLSGFISDFFRNRTAILIAAYALMTISRPVMGLYISVTGYLTGRSLERLSNGIQATPREALVGDLSSHESRGASYGIRYSLGVIGSFVGAVFVYYVLKYIHDGTNIYNLLFWIAAVPPLFALLILILFIKEPPHRVIPDTKEKLDRLLPKIKSLITDNPKYLFILLISAVFMLSNYSGQFIIKYSVKITGEQEFGPITNMLQNFGGVITAYPVGYIADKYGKNRLLLLGFILVIISNTLFSLATDKSFIVIGMLLWGVQMGITLSLLSAKIANCTKPSIRGIAFSFYFIVMAVSIAIANTIMGIVYEVYPSQSFHLSSFFVLIATILLIIKITWFNKRSLI